MTTPKSGGRRSGELLAGTALPLVPAYSPTTKKTAAAFVVYRHFRLVLECGDFA